MKWRNVTYNGVSLKVPAHWPVISFAKRPKACPRLDVHAVYLGKPGPNPLCPAGLVGKTEAVMIGPLSKTGAKTSVRTKTGTHIGAKARKPARARLKPARIMINTRSSASRTLTTVVPRARVQVAISYGIDRPLAQTIQSSIKVTRTTAA
ncbi:MAG TPA: hypothetical protein VF979_10620, partial [Streptosporangiaceae bacterium]